MNNTDKQGLRNSTVAIKSKIIVKATTDKPEIVLTDDNSIKDWEYTDDRYVPQQGFIGQFVARTLSGNLQDITDDFNIENREIELQLGIVHLGEDSEPSWYSFGNFLITNPEGDEVRDNTKFEAMDYTKLFNKTFDGSYTDTLFATSYNTKIENKETVTALWLAQYVCAQVNIELGNTDFVNSDYIIDINPFRNNETCRDVIKEVAKLAYSWVRIDWDNKCYIDFSVKEKSSVDEYDIFTSDHYYTLETKKEKYGPINNVIVGMSNVDGESHSNPDKNSITQNGEHAIYIYDNPLTYTFEHRERANAKGNCLFGLSYAHMTCETIGFPWLRGNELISILDMENNPIYTYPFNKKITFNGHIKSTIDSMGESEVEETLAYESNVVKNARNAFINVNKQEGEIHILSQNIKNVEKEINPPENASGSEIIVEDASNNPLLYLEVEGKSTQETRSGKNLCKLNDSTATSNGITSTITNNIISLNGTASTTWFNLTLNQSLTLEAGTYTVSTNRPLTQIGVDFYDSSGWVFSLADTDTSKTFTLSSDKTITRLACSVASGAVLNIDDLLFQIEVGEVATEFEQFGVSPSPDFPSEIESVGYENLWNNEESTTTSAVLKKTGTGFIYIRGDETGGRYLACKLDLKAYESYTFSINDNPNVSLYFYKDSVYGTNLKSGTNSITYMPTEDIVAYATVIIGSAITDVRVSDIQVTKGVTKHAFIPYGKYGIEVETARNNLWDNSKVTNGSIITNNGTGFKISRYESMSNITGSYEINLKANTTYYISFKRKSYTTTNGIVFCRWKKSDGTFLWAPNLEVNQAFTPTDDIITVNFYLQSTEADGSYVEIEDLQIEEGPEATKFEPYQKNTLLMILNSPLKSLPNGVKDITYIKNNRLYVDHYVGSEVFDGSRDWWLHSGNQFRLKINGIRGGQRQISTHFRSSFDTEIGCIVAYQDDYLRVFANFTTLDEFKTWLSTNNVQVDYELAEPYTEEIGEIDTLKTLLGYNKITTNDDLQPTLNITYVRDTVLADYVENHIAELKINEEQISQRVETIDTSVDGLQTDISRVEQITTDTSQVLNIVSTHIDKTTGDVNAVTTKQKKFTFNDEGLKISAGENGFNSVQDETGTYYYDGTTPVGQYTKDGSKQKDLELFGTYSYGKTDIDDTPMFVGQLYTDENGDEGFGHFYNGGDY